MVPHLDGGIKAIGIDVNNLALHGLRLH
jgi:hypothetical protein